jgi:LemA protein
MAAVLFVICGLVLFAGIISITSINRLNRLKNLVRESWSQVDVALKRRYDLIPNLVETCKAYAAHERAVFERVSEARNRAMAAQGKPAEESVLAGAITGVLGLAEAYPQLQASAHFLALQKELANTEDRIAASRRFYNANVRDYNIAIEQFPSSLFASGHRSADYFEIDSVEVRQNPHVLLS